jgi:hypothetical protein
MVSNAIQRIQLHKATAKGTTLLGREALMAPMATEALQPRNLLKVRVMKSSIEICKAMILLNSLAEQVSVTKYRLVIRRPLADIVFSAWGVLEDGPNWA